MSFVCSEADIQHALGHSAGSGARPQWAQTCICFPRGGAYAQTIPRLWRNILTTSTTITETASEFGKEAKDSIEELGRSAGRKLDEAREETGGALHSAASSVRSAGRQGSAAIDNCSTRTADRLDATASYIEDHDLGDALTGLRRFAHRHPAGTLVAAVAVGFLAGSAICRATHSCGRSPQRS